MRTLRLFLYFALGVLFGGVVTLAHAETIAATQGTVPAQTVYYVGAAPKGTTPLEAANNAFTWWGVPAGYTKLGVYSNSTCTQKNFVAGSDVYKKQQWDANMSVSCSGQGNISTAEICESGTRSGSDCVGAYSCPDSSWTLSGKTCTRADACPPSGTGTGTNEDKVSPSFPNLYGWNDPLATSSRGGAGTYCAAGCAVAFQATVCVQSTQPGTNNCAALNTSYTGATCTGTTVPITSGGSSAKPPCAQGEGVVTMGGKVSCVPVGASPDIPKVSKNSSTKTYPDGSTKVTNTTTTCSGVGACSTSTTITNTGATSGPNAGGAGQAGEPGTTTGEDEEAGDDEFCAKNPDLQMCKGGMSEEGTQKSVLAEIKKLTTAPTDTNFADGDDFDSPMEGVDPDAAQKLTDSYKSTSDALKLGFDDQNAPKSEPKFLEILGNWFDDVPQTGCEPPEFAVAGHTLDLSGWCPTAEKISNIGAYALWFMTLVGLFVMVTGGKGNT